MGRNNIQMSDDNRHSDEDKNSRKTGEFRVPPRTWIVWIAIFGGIVLLMFLRDGMESPAEELQQGAFQQLVESNQIAEATINYNPQNLALTQVTGNYYKTEDGKRVKDSQGKDVLVPFQAKVRIPDSLEAKLLALPGVEVREPNTMLLSVLWSVLPIVLIAALIWFFFIRQIKMAGKGALSFGKSKARLLAKERNKTTFKDVAGVDEAKEEVSELVEFLKDPEEISAARRAHSQGHPDGRPARHRQDPAGQSHCRRSGRRLLQHQRLGFRGDVCRRGRQPRARHVRAGAQEHAVPDFH